MKFPTRVKLAGWHVDRRPEYIRKYVKCYTPLELQREIFNEHDPNAIQVKIPVRKGRYWLVIGYIPADTAAELAPLMDAGQQFTAKFSYKIIGDKGQLYGLLINIKEKEQGK